MATRDQERTLLDAIEAAVSQHGWHTAALDTSLRQDINPSFVGVDGTVQVASGLIRETATVHLVRFVRG